MGVTRVSGYTTRSGRRVHGYTQTRRGGLRRLTRNVGRTKTRRGLKISYPARSQAGFPARHSQGGNAVFKRRARGGKPGRVGNLSNGSVIKPRTRSAPRVNSKSIETPTGTVFKTKRKQSGQVTGAVRRKRARRRFDQGLTRVSDNPNRSQVGVLSRGKPKAAPKGGNKMPAPVGSRDDFMRDAIAKAKAGQLSPSRKNIDGSKERARRKRRRAK